MNRQDVSATRPVLADGFACIRVDVLTTPGAFREVTAAVNRLKASLRDGAARLGEPFPDGLLHASARCPAWCRPRSSRRSRRSWSPFT